MSSLPSMPDDQSSVVAPPVGLFFLDKEAETLWVETQLRRMVRAIRRSNLMHGEGQIVKWPTPHGVKIGGGETTFGMLFLHPLPCALQWELTPEQKEIRRIVSDLNSVLRRRAKVTRLEHVFDELLNSPIFQVVSTDDNWIYSRRTAIAPTLLDELIDAAKEFSESERPCPVSPAPDDAQRLRVELREPEEGPIVRGKTKQKLTAPQYHVVKALLTAGNGGLTKDQLIEKSGHGDAVNILKRLFRKDDDWQNVIHLAGKTGGRYRIK